MNDQHQFDEERVEVQRQIDRVCDKLESMWTAGQAPDIADHVRQFEPESVPGLLSELIKSDREINSLTDTQVRDKYVKALPEYESVIEAILKSMSVDSVPVGSNQETVFGGKDGPKVSRGHDFVGEKIGDYLVVENIGEGTFGIVYLARDMILGRDIVIKIPRGNTNFRQEDIDFFLDEARNSCFLHHEYILRALHVGMHRGLPYIVQDYFEGGDLRKALEQNSYSIEATVDFIRKVAEAIGYAHQFRIIHRDLKPANILIKANGDPVVADFGLAIRDPHLSGKPGEIAGTIQYMSPEQVRGESHRLDGRSDVWSIGVIFYLMLVGRLPFEGEGIEQIRDAILFGRPVPPRQLNEKVSKEINRICLKCLSLRVNDRYPTALDLADDLKDLKAEKENDIPAQPLAVADAKKSTDQKVAVVPKGLMAFDRNDSDFFLELLPGPFDREGIPECIHFWKNRIEDPLRSHPVGLIYGPSGCGKSSLVSAGLLPRLSDDVLVIHIESTPNDTEVRLFKALRAEIPSIPEDPSLPDVVAGIRLGHYLPRDKRLLIVFDQFEQWLHANTIDEHSQLIDALRQCDGKSVQALILVRDDFWMGISRFFRQLEIELVERQNFASVDLFSKRHAKDVLIKFGQAYGTLPQKETEISDSQHQFLGKAIDMIAENDSVICVRSVLFAETVKNQPWEDETLRKIGDSKSIGIVFLEQVLGEGASNPKYRYHRKSLLSVLESLLPDEGVEIKGNLRSRSELAAAAQLEPDDQDFETVLHILDGELRLITPTEPDTGRQQSESMSDGIESWYQLTHDYLVPSLRAWMQSIRGRTRRGRAKLRLHALATQWQASGHSRFLPSLLEYCSILWNVPSNQRDAIESKYMGQASRFYGLRAAVMVLFALLVGGFAWKLDSDNRKKERLETTLNTVSSFRDCRSGELLFYARDLAKDPENATDILESILDDEELTNDQLTTIYIGLTMLGGRSPEQIQRQVNHLVDWVSDCEPIEFENLFEAFKAEQDVAVRAIAAKIQQPISDQHWARLQIMRWFLEPSVEPSGAYEFGVDPTRRTTLIHDFREWHGDLKLAPEMIESVSDAATLSGIVTSLGRIDPNRLQASGVLRPLSAKIQEHFDSHPDACVHATCSWALRTWGKVPVQNAKVILDTQFDWNQHDKDWRINKQQLTMVRIAPNVVLNLRSISRSPDLVEKPFSISACEVRRELFEQFIDDKSYFEEYSDEAPGTWKQDKLTNAEPNTPASNVSKLDAMLFCNWLSRKNGLQPCYELDSDGNWALNSNNGYRLPTHSEWELAARGGCASEYYFSNHRFSAELGEYAWCASNSDEMIHPVGQKIPNRFGLHDILGNVWEICWGHPASYKDDYDQNQISMRGGSYVETGLSLSLNYSEWAPGGGELDIASPNRGFRIVRTIKVKDKKETPVADQQATGAIQNSIESSATTK